MTTTGPSYPLTTTFMPPLGCGSFLLNGACSETMDCHATVFPDSICADNSSGGSILQGCYPSSFVVVGSSPQITYSPGHICPMGMTTAASAISPDGVWCCPTGLSWVGRPPSCIGTLTQGVFVLSAYTSAGCGTYSTITFGHDDITQFLLTTTQDAAAHVSGSLPASKIVLTATATGVFLWGQTKGDADTNATTITSQSLAISSGFSQQNPSGRVASNALSLAVLIGSIVGSVLGALMLVGLGYSIYFLHRQVVKKKRLNNAPSYVGGRHRTHKHPRNGFEKPELDAGIETTRSELEGHSVERMSNGAGIFVQKPELEGTPGTSDAQGDVYVKTKAELEASLHEVSELEAISWSATTRERQILPRSPTSGEPSQSISGEGTSAS
ncbi:hypothetical protein F5Y13DRAFT_184564 [Hypoxylon sp. FL1857]|nr:hypothetical protein F5Y13DRAFT_184564 [Hypoxylon sp. FL1857]